ncbi:E3 ubiquitin-protein ligase UPL7 isoform X1 [Benincasa hispida]|uniref:E3 ubiquitin-protein ligase UPL7 isoform X1 n=1 Tax=Benincasa hispida TaxID=102211 RepID=UPI0018FF8FA4|nr:E3 ubiquitin-protein ligase UPL7 isoform X1 [Benincasa hispida]XP_038904864.1 E3 ubiquitin-protein ligase UPL7 isoform X1 [Benincasa hispida]
MDKGSKHQVSLRGASAKEISRDALVQKVIQEREQRQYARKVAAAALFIQRVWRRFRVTKIAALQLQVEWEDLMNSHSGAQGGTFIACNILRPFLFFISSLLKRPQNIKTRDTDCMKNCFKILFESISSTESKNNFCSLATGTSEERRIWTYQSKKLISVCLFILVHFDKLQVKEQEIIVTTSLAMRLIVVLTDLHGWKSVNENSRAVADAALKNLVHYLGTSESGLYISVRQYLYKLSVLQSTQTSSTIQANDLLVITVSAITLALRPFHLMIFDTIGTTSWEGHHVAEQFCLFLLTIPGLVQHLPQVLVPAVKHRSILLPCFWTLLAKKETILLGMSDLDQLSVECGSKVVPAVGWALANIICFVAGSEIKARDSGWFSQSLDYVLYVRVVVTLAESFLALNGDSGCGKKEKQDIQSVNVTSYEPSDAAVLKNEMTSMSITTSFIDMLRPICEQRHLTDLLKIVNTDVYSEVSTAQSNNMECMKSLKLLDISYFYMYMLRIFSLLNPPVGSLPILNMLSFTPGFLVDLWGVLESSLFPNDADEAEDHFPGSSKLSSKKKDEVFGKKQNQVGKDGSSRWVTVFHKFTSKSQPDSDHLDPIEVQSSSRQGDDNLCDLWDIKSLSCGPQGISKDLSCLLYLFSATYAHLLLVLDDIEFYEKQVPFRLEQQRKLASMLNTLVYNGLSHGTDQQNTYLMESAIRCLHLMYERDCRHQFCPPPLWLSPARTSRPPVAVAARTHEALSANLGADDPLTVPSIGSIITTTPHVFPFEERVEMFREFVKMDKVSRKMAGEVGGPGSRSFEIVVRRSHVVEDGFRQLNSLGSRLKSAIHVSFVSECGLPEAGQDCGGLSKEFLTDIAKAAFSPEYGLFSQTSTPDRHLIPNASARYLDNGIQMIEFLGRVVGKALYEGILLDYSFSHVFVHKLLGRYSFLDELSTLDPELYRNLMYVKSYEGDVKELSLDFTVTEESFGKRHVIELKHGGKDISVTNENKMQYVHAIADYKLNRQILPFSNAFYRGLTDLISPSWLKLFNASEFNQLLSGGNHDIDVNDLRKNTRYTGGYTEGSRTISIFWEVIKGFEPKDRCLLLKFVTSCSRAPLLGFKYLQPAFTIHKVSCDVPIWASIGGQDVERLPTASTCYNTLKLPTYKRSSTLRSKLLYAINSNSGFELS